MRIAEIYASIQGEGLLTGTPSVFVRASGCNLRCHYCDTPFASWNPQGADLSVAEIVTRVEQQDCPHVVLTGGEPMLFAEMIPLCQALSKLGKHITIETAGTLYLPLVCQLMSISPKTTNSAPSADEYPQWYARHERTRHAPDVIRRLISEYDYQFKFVVEQPADVDEVERYLCEIEEIDREQVWLMPEGTTREKLLAIGAWLEPLAEQRGYSFCPRRHIEWFGSARGT